MADWLSAWALFPGKLESWMGPLLRASGVRPGAAVPGTAPFVWHWEGPFHVGQQHKGSGEHQEALHDSKAVMSSLLAALSLTRQWRRTRLPGQAHPCLVRSPLFHVTRAHQCPRPPETSSPTAAVPARALRGRRSAEPWLPWADVECLCPGHLGPLPSTHNRGLRPSAQRSSTQLLILTSPN